MQESGEMYLKKIYLLKQEKDSIRAIDIAKAMNFSKASVSRALNNLKANDLITIDKNGLIDFTKKGFDKASFIYQRCVLIKNFLIKTLKLNDKEACQNACKIEHVITEECFNEIKEQINEEKLEC